MAIRTIAFLCRTAFIVACFLSFGVPGYAGDKRAELKEEWDDISADYWNPPIPVGDEDAHVVIIRDSVHIDDGGWQANDPTVKEKTLENTEPDKFMYVTRHRILLVRDEAGIEKVGIMEFPLEDYSELIDIRARVMKSDGTELVLSRKDFHKRKVVSNNWLDIERIAAVVPNLDSGDIFEVMYKTRSEFEFSPPFIRLYDEFPIAELKVVWKCREQISLPKPEWKYMPDPLLLNRTRADVTISPPLKKDGWRHVRVSARDMQAVVSEPDMVGSHLAHPIFVPGYRWPHRERKQPFWSRVRKVVSEDRQAFLKDTDALEPWLRGIASKPRDREEDLDYCLSILHRKLHGRKEDLNSDRHRYHKNIGDVVKSGEASGEQANWVLVAMLRQLGYDATTAWCGFDWKGQVREDWRSLEQFDEEIVAVRGPDGTDFLFPSYRGSTPNSLPYQLAGGRALLHAAPGEQGEDSPFGDFGHTTASDNHVIVTGRLDATVDPPKGFLEVTWECPAEVSLRNRLALEKSGKDVELLRDRLELDAESVRSERVKLRSESFTYQCSLDVSGMIQIAGEYSLIDVSDFVPDRRRYPEETRRSPIDLRYPRTVVTRIEVVLPPGAIADHPSETKEGDTRFGRFSVTTSGSGNRFQRRAELVIHDAYCEPKDAGALATFFANFADATESKLAAKTEVTEP